VVVHGINLKSCGKSVHPRPLDYILTNESRVSCETGSLHLAKEIPALILGEGGVGWGGPCLSWRNAILAFVKACNKQFNVYVKTITTCKAEVVCNLS
jgi:hypothetical protein